MNRPHDSFVSFPQSYTDFSHFCRFSSLAICFVDSFFPSFFLLRIDIIILPLLWASDFKAFLYFWGRNFISAAAIQCFPIKLCVPISFNSMAHFMYDLIMCHPWVQHTHRTCIQRLSHTQREGKNRDTEIRFYIQKKTEKSTQKIPWKKWWGYREKYLRHNYGMCMYMGENERKRVKNAKVGKIYFYVNACWLRVAYNTYSGGDSRESIWFDVLAV